MTARDVASRLSEAQRREEWRAIPDFEGHYEISSFGRIRSLPRRIRTKDGKRVIPLRGGLLSICHTRKGYPSVSLHKNGKAFPREVHRLVCRVFHGEPKPRAEAAHLDGNPKNCAASNLAWVSRRENHSHKRMHGTQTFGETHPHAKMSEQTVLEAMRAIAAGEHAAKVARRYHISECAFYKITKGVRWCHLRDHPDVVAARASIHARMNKNRAVRQILKGQQ